MKYTSSIIGPRQHIGKRKKTLKTLRWSHVMRSEVYSSFPIIDLHRVGKLVFLHCPKLKMKTSHFNFNSKHHGKNKFELKWLSSEHFPIYFHYENANVVNFVHYGKTRLTKLHFVAFGVFANAQIGNVFFIANFIFPYICCLLPYLHHMLLVNVK